MVLIRNTNLISEEAGMQKVRMSAVLLTAVIFLFSVCTALAGVPQLINYQGRITDKSGAAVPDGHYNVEFKIYDAASGGTILWTEMWDSSTSQIKATGGLFNAMLGTYSAIPDTFFSQNHTVYLGIKFGNDTEMTPRQQITSVGYAFEAANGVPSGAVMMWSGSIGNIPAGWALCDGSNGTPDLRDRFIVGAGASYNPLDQGGNSTINFAHTHTINATDINHTHSGTTGRESAVKDITNEDDQENVADDGHTHNFTTGGMNQNASHSHSENSQLSSSQDIRPPYFALAFIIKL